MKQRQQGGVCRVLWLFLSCSFLSACGSSIPDHNVDQKGGKPNIVLIMADDLGYSDIGCFGGEIRTPNLDRLALRGIRFTNFYSENMCAVSRAALLTGIWHRTARVDAVLNKRCLTLAEALKANGYTTLMSGKWHLGNPGENSAPTQRGFDRYFGMLYGAASYFAPYGLTRDLDNVEHEAQDPDFYLTDAISENAIEFIEETDSNDPLFLYLAYTAAHWPLHARSEDIALYKGNYAMGWDKLREQRHQRMRELGVIESWTELSPRHSTVPSWESEEHKEWQQRRMEVYAAQITVMDRGIGRVIETLNRTGRLENTLVIFIVDNGGCHVEYEPERTGTFLPQETRDGRPIIPGNLPEVMPGPEHSYQSYGYGWANASNTPFRWFKKYDHEGGIHTPMIASWPAGISRDGEIEKQVAHLIDIFPTIVDITGAVLPDTVNGIKRHAIDGKSLAPIFRGLKREPHGHLFFQHSEGRAIRKGKWKLVQERQSGTWELYQLDRDPSELNDLAAEMPERVRELSLR